AAAKLLAEELECVLTGRPIQARPVGAFERVYRWCRRNPQVVGLAAALALTVLSALTLVTFLWRQAVHREVALAAKTEEANRERERAQANLGKARQAVNDSFMVVSDDPQLKTTPGLAPLRRKLLQGGIAYYRDFARQYGDDPTLQR